MPHDDVSSQLREYARVVWQRKWSIVAVVVVVFGVAMMYSYQQTDVYQSSAEVLVRRVNLDPTDPSSAGDFMNLEPERRLATSIEVAQIAADDLKGLSVPAGVSVSAPQDTNTLVFKASSASARSAQITAQAYAEAYLQFRLQEVLDDLRAASAPLEDRIAELTAQIDETQESLSDADSESERTALQIRFNSLFTQRTFLEQKRNDLILPENLQVGRLIQDAGLPTAPSSPNHRKTGLLALVLGLGLGVGQAFVRDRIDRRLRGRGELAAGAGAPVLGVIPRQRGRERADGSRELVTLTEPDSGAAQAYKMLRTAVLFLTRSTRIRTLLITSANAGEGKSLTAANLGVALAQAGTRVTLVSADLHRPMLEPLFEVDRGAGLADVMSGRRRLDEVIVKLHADQLALVPSGTPDNLTIELLGSSAMADVLEPLAAFAEIVILDTPPVLHTADALSLATLADAVLLVADSRQATFDTVVEARERLQQVGANVVGAVLNNVDPTHALWEPYYYGGTTSSSNGGELQSRGWSA